MSLARKIFNAIGALIGIVQALYGLYVAFVLKDWAQGCFWLLLAQISKGNEQ